MLFFFKIQLNLLTRDCLRARDISLGPGGSAKLLRGEDFTKLTLTYNHNLPLTLSYAHNHLKNSALFYTFWERHNTIETGTQDWKLLVVHCQNYFALIFFLFFFLCFNWGGGYQFWRKGVKVTKLYPIMLYSMFKKILHRKAKHAEYNSLTVQHMLRSICVNVYICMCVH